MTSGTQVVVSVDGEKSERFDRVDRYLDRVAALSPAEWGRLDAAGQRFAATDPVSTWQRAQRMASMGLMPPVAEGMMTITVFLAEIIDNVAQALGLRDPKRTIAADPDRPSNADSERMHAQVQRLYAIADAQPGGRRDAVHALVEGFLALHTRHMRTPKSFRRAYASVEAVIPAESL